MNICHRVFFFLPILPRFPPLAHIKPADINNSHICSLPTLSSSESLRTLNSGSMNSHYWNGCFCPQCENVGGWGGWQLKGYSGGKRDVCSVAPGNTEAGENFPVWIITSHEGYSEGPFFFYFLNQYHCEF